MTLLIGFVCAVCAGHPGSGIVVHEDGTVCFVDVGRETVWCVDPDGGVTALLTDHWTHTIVLDGAGGLYYEREERVGAETFRCSLWRMGADGETERLIEAPRDRREFSGVDFVVDGEGNVYYPHSERNADGEWRARIMVRDPEGSVRELTGGGDGALFTDGGAGEATIRMVTAMAMGGDGAIYFADRDRVRRVEIGGEDAGRVTTIAQGLLDRDPMDPPERRGPETTINRLYGIAVDGAGVVYVAYKAGRRVVRVDAEGGVEVVRRSGRGWSPVGVATRGGDVYVLEVGDDSIESLRVVRVGGDGVAETIATR